MNNYQIKFLVVAVAFSALAIVAFNTSRTDAVALGDDDAAAVYKAKCAACHTAKAEKFFDPAKTDEHHAEVILKGKKTAKPPNMPGYEASGMTKKQADALVAYMRQLRAPANTNANANSNGKTNANVNSNTNANVKTNTNTNANAGANVNANTGANTNADTKAISNAEIAQIYKAKCSACHTAKAEKFFDLSRSDAEHIEAVLKGKKTAKPPNMPEFETKGITKEQAAALTEYMKSLRAAPKE